MNYKKELDNIEEQIRKNKEENIRLEEQIKQSKKERTELLAKLKEYGVTEDTVDDVIMELEQDLQQGIANCKSILENK